MRPVYKSDLTEIANLHILLECSTLETAIAACDAGLGRNLVGAHDKIDKVEQQMLAGDETQIDCWKSYDWEFHFALIQAYNSQNLPSLHATIFDKYLRYQIMLLHLSRRNRDVQAPYYA